MPKKFSAKNKIFLLLALWLLIAAGMFMFFFGILDAENQHSLDAMSKQRKDLALLQAEQQSYQQAQADLAALAQKPLQPNNFFSQDITFVNELQILDDWNQKLNVNMLLSGISGTTNTAPRAKTVTPIVIIPYGISISGSYTQVINFLEVLENLSFITNINSLSLSAGAGGLVNANFDANFYLKK